MKCVSYTVVLIGLPTSSTSSDSSDSKGEGESLSTEVAVAVSITVTLLVSLPVVGVAIGCLTMWCIVRRRGGGGGEEGGVERERWVPSMKSQPNHWRVSFLSLITRPMARSTPETNLHVYYIMLSHFLHCPLYYCCNTCSTSRKLTCLLHFAVISLISTHCTTQELAGIYDERHISSFQPGIRHINIRSNQTPLIIAS